jgi:3-methyladenine DNA glycosylase AlkD
MDYALSQPKHLPQNLSDWAFWITEKSWWDTVDLLATRGVGVRLQNAPELRQEVIDQWRNAPNMWLNRTCLLFQLHYKKQTDTSLLADLCHQYAGSKEFFIQKAMGWALRHYSRTDAQWVMNFVEQQPLPALSKREALRLL